PQWLSEIESLSRAGGLRVANVFHAGDGNLHPLVLYDRRIAGQEEAAEALSNNILELCIAAGGSITGEHGVGEDKKKMMSKMFADRKSTRLNSTHGSISYAVFCLKKKKEREGDEPREARAAEDIRSSTRRLFAVRVTSRIDSDEVYGRNAPRRANTRRATHERQTP